MDKKEVANIMGKLSVKTALVMKMCKESILPIIDGHIDKVIISAIFTLSEQQLVDIFSETMANDLKLDIADLDGLKNIHDFSNDDDIVDNMISRSANNKISNVLSEMGIDVEKIMKNK